MKGVKERKKRENWKQQFHQHDDRGLKTETLIRVDHTHTHTHPAKLSFG